MEVTEHQQQAAGPTAVDVLRAPEYTIQPSLVERTGHSHNEGTMSPPPKPIRGPSRPLSFAARTGNRLSLSFPIQLPDRERAGSTRQTPTSATSMSSLYSPAKEPASMSSPKDSAGFMVALAAQERRILELKEELSRAEGDLRRLKRQYAVHEGSKKRAEIKNVEQLRPVDATADNFEDAAAVKRSFEMDRRKALLASVTKDSRRKIITGGHTRTLSLLSPDRGSYDAFPSPSASIVPSDNESTHSSNEIAPNPVMPDTSQGLTRINSNRIRHSYHDSAAIGVKQIAEDIKAGLWTFMEDLRQATVGDEAIQTSAAQNASDMAPDGALGKKGSRGSLQGPTKSHSRLKSVSKTRESRSNTGQLLTGSSTDHAKTQLQTPKPSVIATVSAELDDDDWANWDSPISKGTSPRWSNSTTVSSQDTATSSTARYDMASLPAYFSR
jgi:hypothetical protein